MKEKAAARFHGRRGGGFVSDEAVAAGAGSATKRLEALHRDRMRVITADQTRKPEDKPQWPQHSIDSWLEIAVVARARHERGEPLTITEQRALEVAAVVL